MTNAEAAGLFQSACNLVLARPQDFRQAQEWLDREYGEAAVHARLIEQHKGWSPARRQGMDLDASLARDAADRTYRLRQAAQDLIGNRSPLQALSLDDARRVALIVALLTYDHDVPLSGKFCTWPWDNQGNPTDALAWGARGKMPPTPYVPGRESILHVRVNEAGNGAPTFDPGSVDIGALAALASRAIDTINAGGAPTPPAGAMPAAAPIPQAQSTRNEPSPKAFQAYRAYCLTGETQQKIAKRMGVNQGQVSRWIKQVSDWVEAGNVLPDLLPLAKKPVALDPADIEMGERQDGRTPRQRANASDED